MPRALAAAISGLTHRLHPAAGRQLLTFHHGKGDNFADFEFELIEPAPTAKP